jgi:hypothetical protein
MFVFALIFMLLAMHYIDIAFNMMNLGINYDISLFGKIQDKDRIYRSGIQALFISLYLFTLSFFLYLIPFISIKYQKP